MKVTTIPPSEIFDFLHEVERAGITIPKSVDRWWAKESEKAWPND